MEKSRKDLFCCRFTLCPMSDTYAEIILGALKKTDTTKVWQKTDLMSTLYVGQKKHVLDCISAVFRHTWKEDLHFGGEFAFSKITESDMFLYDDVLNADEILSNSSTLSLGDFPAYAKVAIYAGNEEETVAFTGRIEEFALQYKLQPKKVPLAIMLKGSANLLFSFFEEVLSLVDSRDSFCVLHASVSANSPTLVDWSEL